jgi:hypothetical protein
MVLFGDSSPKARTLNRQLLVDPNARTGASGSRFEGLDRVLER